ncbi:MAG TPA: dTMP kinase [Patescibacteria group bacterium]|nr:dTMP kinase [Patescibacteria group bacterium]
MRRFITFEGIEGSGKTTQIQLLSAHLEERGVDHVLTREPGGTVIGDQVRRLVLDPAVPMVPACELLLYAAARAQHLDQVIRPALAEDRLVLCDRFADATIAYQGYGRGLPIDLIETLHALEALALVPDLTLLFDLDPSAALPRARRRDISKSVDETRFESLGLEFHERVRAGYLDLARLNPGRFVAIDARGSAEEVQTRVQAAVTRVLGP